MLVAVDLRINICGSQSFTTVSGGESADTELILYTLHRFDRARTRAPHISHCHMSSDCRMDPRIWESWRRIRRRRPLHPAELIALAVARPLQPRLVPPPGGTLRGRPRGHRPRHLGRVSGGETAQGCQIGSFSMSGLEPKIKLSFKKMTLEAKRVFTKILIKCSMLVSYH